MLVFARRAVLYMWEEPVSMQELEARPRGATNGHVEKPAMVPGMHGATWQRGDSLPMRAEPAQMAEQMCPARGARRTGARGSLCAALYTEFPQATLGGGEHPEDFCRGAGKWG